jgi:hypothetical protein
MTTMAMLVAVGGLLISLWKHDFTWFARSGSILVAFGLALFSRASVIGEDIKLEVVMEETGLSHLKKEHWNQVGEPVPEWVKEDWETRRAVGTLGPLVSGLGTLIWGFGDLINGPLRWR